VIASPAAVETRPPAGREDSARASHALAIVESDVTLRTAFLLESLACRDENPFTDERASRFLLWFALKGRHRYRQACFSSAYLDFLATPIPPFRSRLAAFVPVAQEGIRERFAGDLDAFHDWYYREGAASLGLGPLISARERIACDDAPAGAAALSSDRSWLPGVNVIGYADGVLGVGEDARALAHVLLEAGIAVCLVNLSLPHAIGTRARHELECLHVKRPLFPINLFALPPIETARIVTEEGSSLCAGRYNIGYWPWELTSLPPAWRGVFDLVDEIWAPSSFLVDVYRRMTEKPVLAMPPYLNLPEPEPFERSELGIGRHSPIFLTLLDFNSFAARKNPEGAIAAFQRAFPDRAGPERLVIKTLNAAAHADARDALAAHAGPDRRILFVDEAMPRARLAGLIAAADCLVSLHRAEGFGRVLAEAMALGTRVVATDWSGSTDFLDEEVGDPVRYELRDVRPGEYVLPHRSRWAEPDIGDAARKLCAIRDAIGTDSELRRRAKERVVRCYGMETVVGQVAARLEALAARGA
jgi:glycosyltransferase involved in cell wall biosynthesis